MNLCPLLTVLGSQHGTQKRTKNRFKKALTKFLLKNASWKPVNPSAEPSWSLQDPPRRRLRASRTSPKKVLDAVKRLHGGSLRATAWQTPLVLYTTYEIRTLGSDSGRFLGPTGRPNRVQQAPCQVQPHFELPKNEDLRSKIKANKCHAESCVTNNYFRTTFQRTSSTPFHVLQISRSVI